MIKKVFKYTDLDDGSEKTEEIYFHLHEADLAKLQLSVKGGMEDLLQQLVQLEDVTAIIAIFDDMIAKSVGFKNERGKFVRTKQYSEEFMSSEQYSDLFIELVGTTEKALEFIKGILPAKLSEGIGEQLVLDLPEESSPIEGDKKLEEYTRDELLMMDQSLFDSLVGTDIQKMPKEHLVIKMQRGLAAKAVEKAVSKQ